MKNIVLILITMVCTSLAQAGYLIGSDSYKNGVIKVEMNIYTEVVTISHCERIDFNCEVVAKKMDSILTEAIDYFQVGASAVTQAGPALVLGLMGSASISAAVTAETLLVGSLVDGLFFSALGAGYTKLITNVKSLNVIRLSDYSRINHDSFLTSEDQLIAFPEDSIAEILNEIL